MGGPAEGQAEPSLSHGAPQTRRFSPPPLRRSHPLEPGLREQCPVTSHFQPRDLLLEVAGRALPGLVPDQVHGQRPFPVGVAVCPCGRQDSCLRPRPGEGSSAGQSPGPRPASTVCQGGRCRMGLTRLRRQSHSRAGEGGGAGLLNSGLHFSCPGGLKPKARHQHGWIPARPLQVAGRLSGC